MKKPFQTKQELLDYLLEGVEEQVDKDMERINTIFNICGFVYTHASGYQEYCSRTVEECNVIGHGDWKEKRGNK